MRFSTGDSSYSDKTLGIFKNTRHALQLASWFSFRTRLDIQETLGQRSYRRSGMPPKVFDRLSVTLVGSRAR
jgi:hypothetical protein